MPTSIRKSRSSSHSSAESRRDVVQAVGWQVQVRAGPQGLLDALGQAGQGQAQEVRPLAL